MSEDERLESAYARSGAGVAPDTATAAADDDNGEEEERLEEEAEEESVVGVFAAIGDDDVDVEVGLRLENDGHFERRLLGWTEADARC